MQGSQGISSAAEWLVIVLQMAVTLIAVSPGATAQDRGNSVADELRQPDVRILDGVLDEPAGMLSRRFRARRIAVNRADVATWRGIQSVEQWEQFRDRRIAALKQSLGEFPDPPQDLRVRVTRSHKGDGFEVDCIVFESRPGLLVTTNLYRPAPSDEVESNSSSSRSPGILICHSHHNPKTQGELQDMGMTWARQGCVVLVMDQLGHGERRQHPFRSSDDFDGEFPVSRQDYHFRYYTGMQLHLIGDSLIGWMVWDLMRGVDLLLAQPDVDADRIVLLGAVAGGGDPASVTAALDPRIKAVVPFNFGGPQPENTFPLPEDAELSFNYVGSGSWESTRNLRLSARDGFLPWVIVGSIAPRRLIYAHEFTWDRDRDPVWKRFETLFEMYGQRDHLASLHGYGKVSLSSSEASHCNNIGPYHRQQIYPALAQWFNMSVPDEDYRHRFHSNDLLCVEGVDAARDIALPKLHELAGHIADERLAACRRLLQEQPPENRCRWLAERWSHRLGIKFPTGTAAEEPVRPSAVSVVSRTEPVSRDGLTTRTTTLETEPGIVVPVLLILPKSIPDGRCRAVVAVSQSGRSGFLRERSGDIAELLEQGFAVCLPDLRGTGETSPGSYLGRRSDATWLSSSEQMLGGTLLGGRLTDLLSVVQWLRTESSIDVSRISIWGDSFAPPNAHDRRIAVPLGIDEEPALAEPLGPTLALLAGVFDEQIEAVVAHHGLISLRSLLDSQFVHVPHDFVVPGCLAAGDLPDLATAIHTSGRRVTVSHLVDGTNRVADPNATTSLWHRMLNDKTSVAEQVHEAKTDQTQRD